jgi:hypothetical protein
MFSVARMTEEWPVVVLGPKIMKKFGNWLELVKGKVVTSNHKEGIGGRRKTYAVESCALIGLWTTAFLHSVDEILTLITNNSQWMKPPCCVKTVR